MTAENNEKRSWRLKSSSTGQFVSCSDALQRSKKRYEESTTRLKMERQKFLKPSTMEELRRLIKG